MKALCSARVSPTLTSLLCSLELKGSPPETSVATRSRFIHGNQPPQPLTPLLLCICSLPWLRECHLVYIKRFPAAPLQQCNYVCGASFPEGLGWGGPPPPVGPTASSSFSGSTGPCPCKPPACAGTAVKRDGASGFRDLEQRCSGPCHPSSLCVLRPHPGPLPIRPSFRPAHSFLSLQCLRNIPSSGKSFSTKERALPVLSIPLDPHTAL